MLALKLPRYLAGPMLARQRGTQGGHQRDAASQCAKDPVQRPSHRVAINRIAHREAIAVRPQKTYMAHRQCRQNNSSHTMTIPALPTIT
jgi:hypothetical protein